MQIINKRVMVVIIFIMFVVILKINSHYSSLKQSYIYITLVQKDFHYVMLVIINFILQLNNIMFQ